MAVEFRRILTDDSRSQSDQALVDCVIDALNHGEPIGELESTLLNVVREADRWAGIRRGALHAYQRLANTDATGELQLLQEIVDGQLDDTDDELLGALLENLYPDHVGPNSILDFLHVPKDQHLLGGYLRFWSRTLLNKTEGIGFGELLDQLAKKRDVLEDHRRDFHLRAMAGKLLSTGIEECGDDVADERLLTWLSVGLDKYDHPNIDSKHSRRIQEWFDKRPDRYKGVLGTCAKGCTGSDNVRYCLFKCLEHLYRAKCPDDLGLWFLEQSESAKCKDLGHQYFIDAVTCLFNDSGAQGMSLEGLFEWVGDHPAYKAELEAQLCWEIPEWRWEQATQALSLIHI